MSTRSAFRRGPARADRRHSGIILRTGAWILLVLVAGYSSLEGSSQTLPAPGSLVRVLQVQKGVPLEVEGRIVEGVQIDELGATAGVVLDARGLITTVLEPTHAVMAGKGVDFIVERLDGRRFEAELLGVDERLDLAVLKVGALRDQAATLGATLEQDELQFVRATAGGWRSDRVHVVDVRSLKHRPETQLQVCGHDGESRLDPDTCAGTLLWDDKARFVGIVSRQTGGTPESGLKFAVLTAQRIRESLLEIAESRTNLRAGWLGIQVDEVEGGLRIAKVYDETPAWTAGLMPGDIVVDVDRQRVTDPDQLISMVKWHGPHTEIVMRVNRHGRVQEIRPRLGVRPPAQMAVRYYIMEPAGESGDYKLRPELKATLANPGFVAQPITSGLARKLKAPRDALLVLEVTPGSLAALNGFEPLDVLWELNGEPLRTTEDLMRLFHSAKDGILTFKLIRNGKREMKRIRLY